MDSRWITLLSTVNKHFVRCFEGRMGPMMKKEDKKNAEGKRGIGQTAAG